jgi:hypothetical protein
MGLPAIEQRVLDTIENDLQITDLQLAATFAAFTRFASGTRMPRPERLTAWHRLITRLRCSHPNAGSKTSLPPIANSAPDVLRQESSDD